MKGNDYWVDRAKLDVGMREAVQDKETQRAVVAVNTTSMIILRATVVESVMGGIDALDTNSFDTFRDVMQRENERLYQKAVERGIAGL